jgi:N-methylhydantoinase A
VFFGDRRHDTPIYSRERLGTGDQISGPAVIEEFGSTLPLHPGFTAGVDRVGNLVVGRS